MRKTHSKLELRDQKETGFVEFEELATQNLSFGFFLYRFYNKNFWKDRG